MARKTKIKCDFCGKEIKKYPSLINKHNFCNMTCYLENLKSVGRTEEHRKKISKTHKGKILTEEHKKKISETSKITWLDINLRKKRSIQNKGPRNPNYKGGVIEKNIPFFDTYAPQIDFCEEVRRNNENPNILEVKCTYCGKWFVPTKTNVDNRIKSLKGSRGENRFYCSEQCKKECPIFKKIKYQIGHPKANYKEFAREVQAELRQMCMERDNYTCQICGLTQDELDVGLHCHHYEGIKHNPLESADLDMVITLCKECHKNVHKLPGCNYNDMKCGVKRN